MMEKIIKIEGQLEIDSERGVIYFHSYETGHSVLRICQLPTPIPIEGLREYGNGLDITHMFGVSWRGELSKFLMAQTKM